MTKRSSSFKRLDSGKQEWRENILSQVADNRNYLNLVSARCSQVRREVRETIEGVQKTQKIFKKAVDRIDKVCSIKIEELKKMGLYDIPETKNSPLNDFVVRKKAGQSKNVKIVSK